ncbi:unnamed protein product [Phytophthora fragariaefolia]|uniref:Unnamed protein product n=1 Tax=Phytophthora fragariaefolia TaxID=1490495 RepID=A0A9W6Y8J7_9STRA|nr:unnamed protein product [Phytophthora fragariaefolia]
MNVTSVVITEKAVRHQRWKELLLLHLIRNSIKERSYITVASLHDPVNSAWQRLYDEGRPGSFVAAVSLPPASFATLLGEFPSSTSSNGAQDNEPDRPNYGSYMLF